MDIPIAEIIAACAATAAGLQIVITALESATADDDEEDEGD